jgi:hypothetical protein
VGGGQPADHRIALGSDLGLRFGQDARDRPFSSGLLGDPGAARLGLGFGTSVGPAFVGTEVAVRADLRSAATARPTG